MVNFVSLHTSLTAIRASQVGLDTAAHNVANANTKGYSRQRVELTAADPHAAAVGPLGAGVDVTKITRARDDFLDRRVRGAEADAARQGVRAELLGRAEAVLAEPDNGVSTELGAVWDAFEDLSLEPSDPAGRQQVVASLESLSGRVRSVVSGWDSLEADSATRASTTVREANDLLKRIGELNERIPVASFRGVSANDLMDERDLAIDKLAAAIGATATINADETVTVSAGGMNLVSGVTVKTLSLGGAPSHAVTAGAPPTTVTPGGRLGGLREFLTGDLATHRAELDDFVSALATELNSRHAQGYSQEPAGQAGEDLLTFDASAGAGRSLSVNPDISADPRRLAAASDPAVAPQDGRNARRLADLRDAVIGGATFDGRVSELAVGLAGDVAALQRAADASEGLALSANSARSSVVAVSLDEEMVSIVQYQRSLEAASRVMTSVDQALDVLVNRTGLVGR